MSKAAELDSKSSWKIHVFDNMGKLCGIMAIIYNLKNTMSDSWLINLYNMLFLTYLMYCATAWGHVSKHLGSKLAIMQRDFLKL